jgi:HEAT repeats
MMLPFSRSWYRDRLDHHDPQIRLRAVNALAGDRHQAIINSLISRVNDANQDVREAAVKVLSQAGDALPAEMLFALILESVSWKVRKSAIELALTLRCGGSSLLRATLAKLQSHIDSLPNKGRPAEEYLYSCIHLAFDFARRGYEFEVSYSEATFRPGQVKMTCEVTDSWREQFSYGSGHPNWDSVGVTYRYEDGYMETCRYEGMGVPTLSGPSVRYKEGLVPDKLEHFELRMGRKAPGEHGLAP